VLREKKNRAFVEWFGWFVWFTDERHISGLTLDPVRVRHRPAIIYITIYLLDILNHIILKLIGFQYLILFYL
jgi:hypothetical protein